MALAGLICFWVTFLSACGKPRPLTLEEQSAYMAKEQCEQFASQMNPDWQGIDNPFWNEDFISCMHEYGIPNAPLRRLWYSEDNF